MRQGLLSVWLVGMYLLTSSAAFAFETKAKAAFVLDQTTGTVLLEKRADAPLPPASMSKLMTLFVAFEAIRDGRLLWDEKLPVSEHAMSYTGSTMFLDTTDRVTVKDLVKGIIVLSGNDACAVIAEALSADGTEAGFAQMMTKRGREIGLKNSNFTNSNGWPAPDHHMSVQDLAILADRLISDFPEQYALFGLKEFDFDGRAPANSQNRNPLLSLDIGADGLKTGHTNEAGYGLVGSAKQGERRLIFVISGLPSAKTRAEEAERIITWAFRQFSAKSIGQPGEILAYAAVWMGRTRKVGLTTRGKPQILLPAVSDLNDIETRIVYVGPIEAPIVKGQEVAELVASAPGLPDSRLPLIAAHDVARGGMVTRIYTAAHVLWAKVVIGTIADIF